MNPILRSLFLVAFFFGISAYPLTTAYLSFDHPEGWRSELAQGVFILQSSLEGEKKEALVMTIAAPSSEWDTFDNFEKYLKQPRMIQDDKGKSFQSKVTYVRRRNINGFTWVDSLQQNSELPGFWARYLVTVQNKLAILVTYIVSDEKYSKMAPQFERMVSSLRPNSEFNLNVASKQGDGPLPGAAKLGQIDRKFLTDRLNVKRKTAEEEPTSKLPLVLVVLLVVGAFVVFKRSNRKK